MAGTVTHTTICRFCHAYCGIEVDVADNHVLAVRGDRDHAISQGFTCEKGRQLPNQHHDPHRLRATLRRATDGSFAEVPSETAMDEVAARLQDIVAEHGPRAVALYNGTKSWSNVSFALGLSWLNGIGSPSFYSTVTVDQPAKLMAGALHGYWQGGYHRIQQSDVVLFVGTNPLQSFLTEGIKLPCPNALVALRAEVQRGLDVIVIDPRRTETAQHAAIHLAVKPGEDPTLLAGMVRLIIAEELYDRAFVAEHGSRFEELRAAVEPFTLDYVERRAGVAADAVAAAARRFARGPRGAAVAGTGPNMAPHPLSTEMLVCVLNTLCGRYGRAGDEVNHAGVLGAGYQPREGALPPREFWGYLEQPRVRGLRTLNWEQPSAALCDEILTPGDGQVRALICNGGNPAVAFPDQEKVVRALESLDLLVCLDVHLGPTARLADYVFGCKLSLEKPDYTRHLEWYFPMPFAQYTPAIIEAEGDVIDEWELFWGLAHRMRVPLELGRAPLGPPVAHPRPVDIDTKPTTDELMEIEAADARVPAGRGEAVPERARVRGGARDDRRAARPTRRGSTSRPSCSSRTSPGGRGARRRRRRLPGRRALHPPARQPPPASGVQLDRHAPAGPQRARARQPRLPRPRRHAAPAAWPTATGWRSRPSTGASSAWRGPIPACRRGWSPWPTPGAPCPATTTAPPRPARAPTGWWRTTSTSSRSSARLARARSR